MKHSITIFFIAAFCSSTLLAQGIKYESSFENAKQLAILEKKPLAVLITIKPQSATPDYMDGLKDVSVIKKFNSSFINYRVDMSDTAVALKIVREYRIKRFPSFLFLDSKGGFMFSDIAFLSKPETLLFMADKAIAESKEKSLAEYDKEYDAGKNSPAFLKDYISRRIKAGINSNGNLIETYIAQLKISDLNDYDQVLFILKAGPVIDGKAFKLAYLNKYIIDSIFKTEPLDVRLAINNAIIENSMQRAIAAKNSALSYSTADFARGSWGKDYKEGQKKWSQKEMQYYFGIKDTARFLQHASYYYDQYYMSLSVDSVRRIDSLNFLAAKKRAEASAITIVNGPLNIIQDLLTTTPMLTYFIGLSFLTRPVACSGKQLN
ncbi:MAG: hypothetical protein A2X18_09600 [Bacteroidetes bacterium GWF2_40_14]|nr:MAG: hypothetical protein A2X18_09600 [Bacteroidetes bacterium GWF2_40_14]